MFFAVESNHEKEDDSGIRLHKLTKFKTKIEEKQKIQRDGLE